MQCNKCGGELDGNARFCRFCGNRIEPESLVNAPEEDGETVSPGYGGEEEAGNENHTETDDGFSAVGDSDSVSDDLGHTGIAKNNKIGSKTKYIIFAISLSVFVVALICAIAIKYTGKSSNFEYFTQIQATEGQNPILITEQETQSIATEPETEEENTVKKIVIAEGGLWMRKTPHIENNNKLGLIPEDTEIYVERIIDNWAYTTYKGISGWCSCDYLCDPSDCEGEPLYSSKVTVKDGLRLRKEPVIDNGNIITTIPYKATVKIYEEDGEWVYVSYKKISGWSYRKYLD